jgi:hypothetical protein
VKTFFEKKLNWKLSLYIYIINIPFGNRPVPHTSIGCDYRVKAITDECPPSTRLAHLITLSRHSSSASDWLVIVTRDDPTNLKNTSNWRRSGRFVTNCVLNTSSNWLCSITSSRRPVIIAYNLTHSCGSITCLNPEVLTVT